jgi:hypothetical protein
VSCVLRMVVCRLHAFPVTNPRVSVPRSHFNIMRDELGNPAGCEVVTGGSIDDPSMVISQHWLFELMVSVLRWENACVSPLFLAF